MKKIIVLFVAGVLFALTTGVHAQAKGQAPTSEDNLVDDGGNLRLMSPEEAAQYKNAQNMKSKQAPAKKAKTPKKPARAGSSTGIPKVPR